MKGHKPMIGIWLAVALVALLAACGPSKGKVVEPIEKPLLELAAIDSLMWQRPDSALAVLQEFVVSPEADSLDAFNGHYCQLLISELLYKNDYGQSNREDLLKAVAYFDTLGNAFFDARAHYTNGVGFYERDSVVQACAEYLKALEVMEEHYREKELVGEKAKFMSYIYNRLGDVFEEQLLAEPAITCYKQALSYCRRQPTSIYGTPVLLYNLGILYNIANQKDSAAFYYDEALANMPDFDNLHYRDLMANKTIFAYYNMNCSSDSVITSLKHLVALSADEEEKTTRILTLGNILFEDRQYDSSLVYLEAVFAQQGHTISKLMAAENLSSIYQMKGDSIKAQEYASFLAGFTLSEIEKKTDASKTSEMFNDYLTQKQEKQAKIERKKAVNKVWNIIIPTATLALLAVVYVLRLRNKKQLKNQQEETERTLEETKKRHEEELRQLKADTEQQLEELGRKHQQWMAETRGRHAKELEAERLSYEKQQDALRQNLKEREAQLTALEKTLNLLQEEAKQRRMAFLKEPICQHILNKARSQQITTRYVAHELGIALKDEDFEQLREAVEKHYEGFDRELLSQCPGLKQGLLSLCHLHLLGLNESEIGALKNLSYSAIKKQNESLRKKLGANEDMASYVLWVAESLCGTQDVSQDVPQDVPQEITQAILDIVSRNPKITKKEIARQMGVSSRTVGRYLKKLEGCVRYVGSGYSGHWEVM